MTVQDFLTIALATYLLSKLLTRFDSPFGVLGRVRDWIISKSQEDRKLRPYFETLAGIWTCQFCMSFYVLIVVGLLWAYVPFLASGLAVLGLVSLFQAYDPGE